MCSVAPNTALGVATNDLLKRYLPDANAGKGNAAFSAGFIAGIVSTPFKGVAQTKDSLMHLSKKEIILRTLRANRVCGLMRGALSVAFQEGFWGFTYMAAPVAIGAFFESKGIDPVNGQRIGALTAGASFGLVSCIFKQFQFHKQCSLTTLGAATSYPEIAQNLWKKVLNASVPQKLSLFFIGGVPRTIASAAAAVLLHEGMKYYDEYYRIL